MVASLNAMSVSDVQFEGFSIKRIHQRHLQMNAQNRENAMEKTNNKENVAMV